MGMLSEEKDKAPRSVAEAKKQGKSTYTGKDGKQKAAVYKEDLGKGQSLKDYLNKGGGRSAPTKDSGNDYKAGNPRANINKGGLGVSQTNRPRIAPAAGPGFLNNLTGFGYKDQNGDYISALEDMQDGGGRGGSGPRFEGGISDLSNAIGSTPYGSGREATGIAKFTQDGGFLGSFLKGLNITGKPTTPTTTIPTTTINGGGDNSGIASLAAAPETKCPPGYMLDPKTNSCVPDMQAFANKGAVAMPGFVNPTIEQMIAAQKPVKMAAEGGLMSLAEEDGSNEKTIISDAIAAIENGAEDEAAAMALGKFVQVHGEDALRDLVEKVQSGDYADTRERFANGENGIVKGPGDGSGVDDKVPATIDGEKDVLLAAGEMVLRKKTTDALEAALGEGGLDAVNAAEGDAPAVLRRLMNNVQAERQTA
jgi:hypothetical protein